MSRNQCISLGIILIIVAYVICFLKEQQFIWAVKLQI